MTLRNRLRLTRTSSYLKCIGGKGTNARCHQAGLMLSPLKVPQLLAFHKRNLAATSEKLALPYYLVDITVTSLYGGLDVLIHVEEVSRVVLVLERHQPLIVSPVGRLDALLPFIHQEVNVASFSRVGMQR
jgi:hypothetical protein